MHSFRFGFWTKKRLGGIGFSTTFTKSASFLGAKGCPFAPKSEKYFGAEDPVLYFTNRASFLGAKGVDRGGRGSIYPQKQRVHFWPQNRSRTLNKRDNRLFTF